MTMAAALPTVFANSIRVLVSETELVLEFGTNFPAPGEKVATGTPEIEVRVVLPITLADSLPGMIQGLRNTKTPARES